MTMRTIRIVKLVIKAFRGLIKVLGALMLLAFLLNFLALQAKAQDPQFSQFYASPIYLNPALTGSTDRARRV